MPSIQTQVHMVACLQAAKAGRADVVQKLIDLGVQLAAQDAAGNTPLHMAVKLKASKTWVFECVSGQQLLRSSSVCHPCLVLGCPAAGQHPTANGHMLQV